MVIEERKYKIHSRDVEEYLYMIMRDLKTYDRIIMETRDINDPVGQEMFGEFYNKFIKDITRGKVSSCRGCIELIGQMKKQFLLYRTDKSESTPIIYNRLEKARKIVELLTNLGVNFIEERIELDDEDKTKKKIVIVLEKQRRFKQW